MSQTHAAGHQKKAGPSGLASPLPESNTAEYRAPGGSRKDTPAARLPGPSRGAPLGQEDPVCWSPSANRMRFRRNGAAVSDASKGGGNTSGSCHPLAVMADCFSAQIALKGGVQAAIKESKERLEQQTLRLAEAALQQEQAKLKQLVQERISVSSARRSLPIRRLAQPLPNTRETWSFDIGESPDKRAGGVYDRFRPVNLTCGADKIKVQAVVIPEGARQARAGSEGLPMYMTWTYVNKNMTTKEEGRQMFYTDDAGETVPASDSDDDGGLDFIGRYVGDTRQDEAAVREVLRRFGRSSTVLKELMHQLDMKHEDLKQIEKEIFKETVPVVTNRLGPVLARMNSCFCRRCRIYGCKLHACGQEYPASINDPQSTDETPEASSPCGPFCWQVKQNENGRQNAADDGALARNSEATGSESRSKTNILPTQPPGSSNSVPGTSATSGEEEAPWTDMQLDLIHAGVQMYGSNSCQVAALLGDRHCRAVKQYIDRHNLGGGPATKAKDDQQQQQQEADINVVPRGKMRKGGRPKKSQPNHVVKKRLAHDRENAWPQYSPCNCAGACDEKTCSCAKVGNFCEKFCGCSKSCNLRFPGCNCKSNCSKRACPCLAAGRECDPDLCKGCAPTCTGEAPEGRECCNMHLRLRQHARIIMGLSSVAGWGAFLQHSVKKNDFLGEYTGEIISQDEADRRGKVYDRVDNSYLFNLNEQSVLDARQFGNKLRFINHSKTNANCYAVILLVDGEHRVGIFAKQDIKPGVELFYDYRYDNDFGPRWAQKQ
mmetsp:Transcript_24875/g.69328  ORF Transcript_24875/g.69328 Transcript_24875/m.69328 type:complete len:774 (+) Transcript_24875:212-2533(+)